MYRDLFQNALNIEDPYFIKNIGFDYESNQLDIWIDFSWQHIRLPPMQ